MNQKIYRQADSRWGSLPYPTKAYKFAGNGCGCCAVTHCAIEQDKYKNYTPADVRKYMVQFATKGHGTLWNGITKGLQYYGYNVHWNQKDSMSDIWKVLKTSLKRGVILFGSSKGGSQKITWTTSGHYVAFVDWKYENGDYWFYTKDSGGRHRDGWHSYKKHMAGDVRQVWICTSLKNSEKPITKPTGKYSGSIPSPTLKKGSKGTNVGYLQSFLNWYGGFKLSVDKSFGPKTESALRIFQLTEGISVDGIYGKQSQGKANAYKASPPSSSVTKPTTSTTNAQKIVNRANELAWPYGTASSKWDYKKGNPTSKCKEAMKKYKYTSRAKMSSCAYFCNTVVRDSGVNKSFGSLHGYKKAFPKTESGFNTVLSGKSIPSGFLQPGDIVRYKKTTKDEHVLIYMGNGRICEARHYHRFGNIYKDEKRYNNSKSKKSTIQVLRAK